MATLLSSRSPAVERVIGALVVELSKRMRLSASVEVIWSMVCDSDGLTTSSEAPSDTDSAKHCAKNKLNSSCARAATMLYWACAPPPHLFSCTSRHTCTSRATVQ